MKNLTKRLIIGIQIGTGIIISLVIGLYLVNAWSGTDNLTAGPGDKLTATKLNQILAKINSGGGSASGIIYNSSNSVFDFSGSIRPGTSSTCDSTSAGSIRYDSSSKEIQACNGSIWVTIKYVGAAARGSSLNPGNSCLDLLNKGINSSANYRISVGGNSYNVYCDMTSDGGGRTLAARIAGGDSLQLNSANVGALTSESQGTTAKLPDTVINAIKTSSGGIKMKCNGASQVIFSYLCNFSAGSQNADTNCHRGSDKVSRYGVSNRVGSPGVIYGYVGGNYGCYNGSAWGNAGTLRIK